MTMPVAKKYPKLKGTIFIVTYGRSGSTLLQSMLQGIPGAHIVGENFGALYFLFSGFQRLAKAKRKWGGKEQPKNSPWYGADKLDPVRFRDKMVNLFVEEAIQPPKNVRWYGFKEIRYGEGVMGDDFEPFVSFLRRAFPNAYIVFNSRNGQDVSKSRWWKKSNPEDVQNMVRVMDAKFEDYTRKFPERCFHARYEDTVADPACLKPLFDMLGEPFDPERAQEVLNVKLKH